MSCTSPSLEAVADELDARFAAIPIFATGTGPDPEEWIALERADFDREARVVYVRRRFSGGELKDGGKTAGSVRSVPLHQRVLDAPDAMPPRIDTRLLFPAPRGRLHRPGAVPPSRVGARATRGGTCHAGRTP